MTLLGFERRWILEVFAAVAPGGAHPLLPEGAEGPLMSRFLDDLAKRAPTHFLLGLRACAWVVMFSPPFVLGRWKMFTGLSAEEKFRLLDELAESDVYVIREMPLLFKTIACLGFCGLPAVQAKIGVHPIDASPPAWARRSLPMNGASE
jgi:hypothetical protein